MKIPIHHVDAFTNRVFAGNPAAVCPLADWLDDSILQAIASENNLSETAFLKKSRPGEYQIRWMTPTTEVDLCGHATLASALVVFEEDPSLEAVTFHSKSGPLRVTRDSGRLVLDFPSRPPKEVATPPGLAEALGCPVSQVLAARDHMVVLETEAEVSSVAPRFDRLLALRLFGVIVTARGDEADFVSRFFAPSSGVDEDPVTGSAHCTLVPFWAAQLGRARLRALQISRRGGELFCEHRGERVLIAGHAVRYLDGVIEV